MDSLWIGGRPTAAGAVAHRDLEFATADNGKLASCRARLSRKRGVRGRDLAGLTGDLIAEIFDVVPTRARQGCRRFEGRNRCRNDLVAIAREELGPRLRRFVGGIFKCPIDAGRNREAQLRHTLDAPRDDLARIGERRRIGHGRPRPDGFGIVAWNI